MDDVQKMVESMLRNQRLEQTFFEVETAILSILDFKTFFEQLLTEIETRFEIPYVWISLIDETDWIDLITDLNSSMVLRHRLNLIKHHALLDLLNGDRAPLLANADLRNYFKLFPKSEKYLIRSLAVAPLCIDDRLIGSLNLGDPTETRYAPGMDTTLLKRLGVITSLCLANVSAHEKLAARARRDPLTGLTDRNGLKAILKKEFSRAKRFSIRLSAIHILVETSDASPHAANRETGNRIIRRLAARLKTLMREYDVLTRISENEFLVVLPHTDREQALQAADRILTHFNGNPLEVPDWPGSVSVHCGVAEMGDQFVHNADSLLKRAGDNCRQARRLEQKRIVSLTRQVSRP